MIVGESARIKLDRADFHLKELRKQVNSGEHQPGGINYWIDYEKKQLVVVTEPNDTLLRWSVIAGEIVHQSRSALDHVVWDLIVANGNVPKEREAGFPVIRKEAKYKERVDDMIGGMNEQARTIIAGLQPFGPDYASDPLYILNEMWNWDKHRKLNINTVGIMSLRVRFDLPDGVRSIMVNLPEGPLPERAEIARSDIGFDLPGKVRMSGSVWGWHQFVGGPASGKSFLKTLSELHKFSESVVDKLIATAS